MKANACPGHDKKLAVLMPLPELPPNTPKKMLKVVFSKSNEIMSIWYGVWFLSSGLFKSSKFIKNGSDFCSKM